MTRALITFIVLFVAAIAIYFGLALVEPLQGSYWFLSLVFVLLGWALAWAIGWVVDAVLATLKAPLRISNFLVPAFFGVTIIVTWEYYVKGSHIPLVLLPAPTQIGTKFLSSLSILGADFVQTILRAVIPGWLMGCGAGFLVALLCDRIDFLRRGLLPLGNLVAALPIVGVAPILVMWFGFDWPSKAAMVVVMTFFPMLINTLTGLNASGHMERDLMKSYGANWFTTAETAPACCHAIHF
jgi:NitT/TauT family transport system permease protein